ncbi:MAG: cation acetate symporter [Betaproteobacteria bacterium]|nr:cation acetate symporter [Betaproteobacteria bacterium]
MSQAAGFSQRTFNQALKKYYSIYTGGFIAFIILLAIAEQLGLPRKAIGLTFLFATIGLYALIGIMSRTAEVAEYYVAGRRVPAFFNGMATAADWMSAASFIAMAGTLYLAGYDGLSFIMGWTGGYVLVAVFLAPYLRKFGQFTVPDFLGARYGGNIVRTIGVISAITASFVYVVAQIYGVGLITSRFTGLEFGVGVFVGLAGILVCSFLGGMRAVTWTQVAQYVILIIAYLIPIIWLGMKHLSNPVPHFGYGLVMQRLADVEKKIIADPKEAEVRKIAKSRSDAAAAALKSPEKSFADGKAALEKQLSDLKAANAPADQVAGAEKALAAYPKDIEEATKRWTADRGLAPHVAPLRKHAEAYPGKDEEARDVARRNFLGIVICMMFGTAALPHILMRYYTTPSVREARNSVFWTLFFICLLYTSAPVLAVLAKFDVYTNIVGIKHADIPGWLAAWRAVDPDLIRFTDINGDGILQAAEMRIGGDLIVLMTPELAGLPYVISGLVAAGGLAAALSTADGLLLTIANALSHDVYYKMIDPSASTKRRVTVAKALLLVVALVAAWVTSYKPGHILFLVGAAFSLAMSAFFPALVLGIFWKRANKWGAITGMVVGLGVCIYYMLVTYPFLRDVFGITRPIAEYMWFKMNPISAGVFGMPAGFITIVIVSLLTPAPDKETQDFIEHVRYPRLAGDIDTRAT